MNTMGYADRRILVRLFQTYCSNFYGCELWATSSGRALRELGVAYHSSIKRLVKVPKFSRNHPLCHELGLLTCQMHIEYRQLLFIHRLQFSNNSIIKCLQNSDVARTGLLHINHLRIREKYDILGMDLSTTTKQHIYNVFWSRLRRMVENPG